MKNNECKQTVRNVAVFLAFLFTIPLSDVKYSHLAIRSLILGNITCICIHGSSLSTFFIIQHPVCNKLLALNENKEVEYLMTICLSMFVHFSNLIMYSLLKKFLEPNY